MRSQFDWLDCLGIQDAIRSCHDKLLQIMDVDNGMTGRLIEKDLITSEEYDEICDQDNYMEQNETLLNKMYSRMSTRSTELFMKILLDTKQEHVANYIKNSAGGGSHFKILVVSKRDFGFKCLRSASRGDLVVLRFWLQTLGHRAFAVSGPQIWNSLPLRIRQSRDKLLLFKQKLKAHLFQQF